MLVDGGVVNLVPYDLLIGHCDLVIAVDVAGPARLPKGRRAPTMAEAVLGAFDISQAAILDHKMRIAPPDILIRIGLRDIPVLDFGRTDDVLRRGRTAAAGLRRTLEQAMMGTARLQRRAALGASDGRRCCAGSV
ncbi:MAG: hypothetical protein KJ579_04225 [Verrucomicrobia bacterium]|nr:hypothetical protein [Verrucomicrobiota bacterium]